MHDAFRPRDIDPDDAARLSRDLGIHPVTAQILVARGVTDAPAGRRFLQPGPDHLHDPRLFRDMDRAVDALLEAVRAGTRIAVYGDYDVDGVSSTTIMTRILRLLNADVRPFIPHRLDDGFGLSRSALDRLREEGCGLVVTVDNGTSRADEIARAQEAGLQFVVTDHHEPGETLPPCPVVNPKRADRTYPFTGLAGCGVAFKTGCALVERLHKENDAAFRALLPDLLALVAIGTVADVMPLVDENRSLVALGLGALSATRHAGLLALKKTARCDGRPVRAHDIGYRLGPRLNAAGRLGSADLALDLLLCDDPQRAEKLAQQLEEGNLKRQELERALTETAFEQADRIQEQEKQTDGDVAAYVLGGEGWHAGIIGIVAARITETYRRPAAILSVEGGEARGSARCFGRVRLHEALAECSDLLTSHGGHAKAAGFTMQADRVDAFRTAFQDAVRAQGANEQGPREVDAELPIDAISAPLAAEIESLRPFGSANPEPLFCAYGVRAAGRTRRTGNQSRHLSFFAASRRASVRAIAYNQADHEELLQEPFDIAFVLRRPRMGREKVELHVREIAPSHRAQ